MTNQGSAPVIGQTLEAIKMSWRYPSITYTDTLSINYKASYNIQQWVNGHFNVHHLHNSTKKTINHPHFDRLSFIIKKNLVNYANANCKHHEM